MKKFFVFTILFCGSTFFCFAQKSKPTPTTKATPTKKATPKPSISKTPVKKDAVKSSVKSPPTKPAEKSHPKSTPKIASKSELKVAPKSSISKAIAIRPSNEISDGDWKSLIDAAQVENWSKTAMLAESYLTKVNIENDKKQIARLRYILLYALAGKIIEASTAKDKTEEIKARAELEKTANEFVGKEFFMPSREIARRCEGWLNYVCRSNQQPDVLRVTATNHSGIAIFSFEYVRLKEEFFTLKNSGKEVILNGVLDKFEINPELSNIWIMRLFFENGSANLVPDQ